MLAAVTAAFITVFVAEFGDKSQLVCLTMACRYPPLHVLAGAMTAMAIVLGLAVAVGGFLAASIPHSLIAIISGLVFITIGLLSFFRKDGHPGEFTGNTGFVQTMTMIFFAEFGDKTQLAVIFLTAAFGYPLLIFAGAMVAMLFNHLLAVYLGRWFISQVNPRYIRIGTAVLFIAIGLFMLVFEAGILP